MITVRTSRPPGVFAGRRMVATGKPAAGVIDVHRRKAALVVMRVPERQLLAAVGRIERVVDIEDIAVRRRDRRGELIDERASQTGRIRLRRRVLEAADGRLRGEGRAGLRAAANGHLQRRIVAQRVVIDAVFVAAADAEHARRDDLGQTMPDARRITSIRPCRRHARADADLLLGATQEQHTGIRRLIAAIEIDCEFLARHSWQVEWKRRSVGHGRGVPLCACTLVSTTVCYVISTTYATANAEFLTPDA